MTMPNKTIRRLTRLWEAIQFSFRLGADIPTKYRLAAQLIKPFFNFALHPARLHVLRIRYAGKAMTVTVRDNGSDMLILREMFMLQDYLTPGRVAPPKVIYDIGANVGLAATYFAAVYPSPEIYGFEPGSDECRICRLNYANVETGRLFPVALGSENTDANLLVSVTGAGGQTLEQFNPDSGAERRKVQVRRLETLVETEHLPLPDLLKIDVEGAEYEVLKGAGAVGRAVRLVVMEVHSTALYHQCATWLKENGFDLLRDEQKGETEVRFLWAQRRNAEQSQAKHTAKWGDNNGVGAGSRK